MAESSIPISRHCISVVNESNPHNAGKSIIFINGLCNSYEDAEENAKLISSFVNDKRVILFYNPTLSQNEYSTKEKVASFSCGLANLIGGEFIRCKGDIQKIEEIKILIFAHSHGAVLLRNAMNIVTKGMKEIKNNVHLVSLGGATLLSDSLSENVENFIHEFDWIPLYANSKLEDNQLIIILNFLKQDIIEKIKNLMSVVLYDIEPDVVTTNYNKIGSMLLTHFSIRSSEEKDSLIAKMFKIAENFVNKTFNDTPITIIHSQKSSQEEATKIVEVLKNPHTIESLLKLVAINFHEKMANAHSFKIGYSDTIRERCVQF